MVFSRADGKPLRDVSPEDVGTGMRQRAGEIAPDIASHLLVPSTERVIFGQEPFRLRIDHAREQRDVLIDVLALDIVHREQFLAVMFVHLLEDLPFDHHEPGRGIENPHEPVVGGIQGLEIDVEIQSHLPDIFGLTGLDFLGHLGPIDGFLGVHRADDILIEIEQTEHQVGVESDIRIDEQKVREIRVLQVPRDQDVPSALDERFVPDEIDVNEDPTTGAQRLERDEARRKTVGQ